MSQFVPNECELKYTNVKIVPVGVSAPALGKVLAYCRYPRLQSPYHSPLDLTPYLKLTLYQEIPNILNTQNLILMLTKC